MATYLSLNPKLIELPEARNADEKIIHVYRMLTLYLSAAAIEHGPLSFSADSLTAAMAHLQACDEWPTFRVEQFSDGCHSLELVRQAADGASEHLEAE